MSFDGIVMHNVINQLDANLKGGKVNKIYQISKYELLFYIRANFKNVKLLVSCHPNYARLHLTQESYPTPQVPSQLTMTFRKHLEGAFIKSVKQLNFERICEITFLGRNEMGDDTYYSLMVEIMGKHSNVTLCKEDKTVIDALKRINPSMSTVRIIIPGTKYDLPPIDDHKKLPTEIEAPIHEKLYLDYQGLSPILCKELVYQNLNDVNIQQYLENLLQSDKLYIFKRDNKEEFHLAPLHHYSSEYKEYDLFIGLDTFYKEKDENDRIKQQTSDLMHFIKAELTKNQTKLSKLEQELYDSTNCEDLKLKGELLYSYLGLVKKGMSEVVVDNYYTNEKLVIELDVRLDGKQNAKRYFTRYTKAKNAINYLETQIDLTLNEIEYFEDLLSQMNLANYYDAIEMKEELENLGYIKKKKKNEGKKKNNKPHYTTYIAKDGTPIYIGKNNIQNDYLTFKMAKKSYTWFHVKDMPGSHVIVGAEVLDEYLIRTAANIASLFSKAQDSSSVPVNYTKVQFLKKAPGNVLGKVILNQYKTIYIDPDKELLNEIK